VLAGDHQRGQHDAPQRVAQVRLAQDVEAGREGALVGLAVRGQPAAQQPQGVERVLVAPSLQRQEVLHRAPVVLGQPAREFVEHRRLQAVLPVRTARNFGVVATSNSAPR
jgi:hypothetical protein